MGLFCAVCIPHLIFVEPYICGTGEISVFNSNIDLITRLAKICQKIVNLYLVTLNFVEQAFTNCKIFLLMFQLVVVFSR